MKRALPGFAALSALSALSALGACSRGSGPSFDVVVQVDSDRAGGGAELDRDVLQPIERALGSGGVPLTTRGRAAGGRGTIVVTPGAGVDVARLTAELHRVLETVDRRGLGDWPSFEVRTLPETSELFVFRAAQQPQSVDALAAVPGVRALDSCGLRQETAVIYADPARMAAVGVTLAQLASAAGGSGELAQQPVGTRGAKVRDVASVSPFGERTCTAMWGDGAAAAVLEVHGFGADRDKLAALAATGEYRDPWEVARVAEGDRGKTYASRVRFEAGGPFTIAATEKLLAGVTATSGVAWAIAELEQAAGTARIVVGMRAGAPPELAANAVRRAVAAPDVRAVVDALGGAVEVEAVLGNDAAASAALAALRGRGAEAGCDACSARARLETRYVVDDALASRLQIAPADSARVIAALQPGGLELAGGRHLVLRSTDLSTIYVTGADGELVPFSAIAHVESVLVYPGLSEDGKSVVTVWLRAETAEAARAALAAAVPPGTVIRPRRADQ